MDLSSPTFYAPTEDDLARGEADFATIQRYARLKSYNVKIFNLAIQSDIEEYTKTMAEIMEGLQKKTHFVWNKEKTIVDGNWKIFLEWSVYELNDPSKPKEQQDENTR